MRTILSEETRIVNRELDNTNAPPYNQNEVIMSNATRLPRKYLNTLEEAGQSLRLVGQQATQIRQFLAELDQRNRSAQLVGVLIRDIETAALRVALELSQIKVADTCDNCPAAPAVTTQKITLVTAIGELERVKQFLHKGLIQNGEEISL